MKKILLVIMIVAMPDNAFAQAVDAGAVLDKTSQIYRQWDGMNIKFTMNIRSDKSGISESFEGTIAMKADKFILETPDIKTWFDGTTQWTYVSRTGEVNVHTPTGGDLQMLNPMLLLQGYQKDFNVSYIGESTSANVKTAYDVALIPRKKDDIEKIELQIEKGTSLLVKITVTMRNDMRNVIHVKTIKEAVFPDDIFTFPESEYPDAEMIDSR